MKFTFTSLISGLLLLSAASLATAQQNAQAEQPQRSDLRVNEAANLDQLLQNVRQRTVVESRLHAEREARFRRDKDQQQQLLSQARSERTREERRSEQLETRFEENEIRIGQLQEQLSNRLGSLRELFGVLQQVSGDTRGLFDGSIISAQYPNRGDWLDALARRMGTASSLASIDEMETLWFELQREMTESGKVVKFPATVIMNNGQQVETEVTRIGAFNLVANGRYIQYDPADDSLVELARQPAGRFTATASRLAQAGPEDIVAFAVDPTRGSLLSLLIQAATVGDRVGSPFGGIATGECYLPFCNGEGGYVGSVIIMGGIFGVILALWKLVQLSLMGRAVAAQKNSETPDEGNPLGRVLKVYHDNRDVDVETLELKLGEAILGETPKITSNITLMQVISVVAPLLGLLGTVIGMILTFQAITLFGTGDPKTMAGGISTALMTTVLGLCVAIPMTLLHSIVATRSRAVIHVLEEQSAGIVADHAERTGQALG
jgi:biopolymer transport protein ExbB